MPSDLESRYDTGTKIFLSKLKLISVISVQRADDVLSSNHNDVDNNIDCTFNESEFDTYQEQLR